MDDLSNAVFVRIIGVRRGNPAGAGFRQLFHVSFQSLVELGPPIAAHPMVDLVHKDKSRAVTFVGPAGSSLRLDRTRLARLELDYSLTNLKAVFLLSSRLREKATDKVHRLFGLVQCRGTDLNYWERYGLPYGESEGIKVTEATRPQELNYRKRCKERGFTPSLRSSQRSRGVLPCAVRVDGVKPKNKAELLGCELPGFSCSVAIWGDHVLLRPSNDLVPQGFLGGGDAFRQISRLGHPLTSHS